MWQFVVCNISEGDMALRKVDYYHQMTELNSKERPIRLLAQVICSIRWTSTVRLIRELGNVFDCGLHGKWN